MQFFEKPYDEDANALQWFMFTGLIIVFAVAWNMILRDIKGYI